MTDTLQRVEYNIIPGNKHHSTRSRLRFSFLSSVPSIDVDPNPLFYQDRLGSLLGCNKRFEQLMQKQRHEIIGKTTDEVFPPVIANCINQYFETIINSVEMKHFLQALVNADTKRKFLLTMTRTSADLDEPMVISTLLDLSGLPEHALKVRSDFELGEMDRQNTTRHLELLLRFEKTKSQLLDCLNNLHHHMDAEGRTILTTAIRHVRHELSDETSLRAEREFDDCHGKLYEFLREASARITKTEMRLCALFSLDNSLVEIARLTHKSANSVNVAFARIRMKLQLPCNNDLKIFLRQFDNPQGLAKKQGGNYCHGLR